ncbi:DUF1775 domain-containing protein [Kitasatospora sp. NPDC127059]|uniref:DUF1775 domain-containing protein n=1 Tax=unclassified Kitasatospora TaxID=2633591 RepID=UPI00365CE633
MARRTGRHRVTLAAAAVGAAGAVLLSAGPASAHVRVFADGAVPGQPATLRFRVPSEKADATTVRVEVSVPAGLGVTEVPPVAGWEEQTVAQPGNGSRLIWTATAGHAIRPDDHQLFEVRVGPLPRAASLRFETVQTYSDGSVVDWGQGQVGSTEAPFPAPVLLLEPAAGSADGTASGPTGGTGASPTDGTAATDGTASAIPRAPARALGAPPQGTVPSRTLLGASGVLVAAAVLAAVRMRGTRRGRRGP